MTTVIKKSVASSIYKAPWWLPGRHLQTIWPSLRKRKINLHLRKERLELPDGDFLDLAWTREERSGPLVVVLHGLEGSIESSYAKGILRALDIRDFQGVFMHFRSCGGEYNRMAPTYHAGSTKDLAYVLKVLQQRYPARPIMAVGYSLGGNVLLKYLGETGSNSAISAAVCVSVPFLLHRCSDKLQSGFSKIYQKRLLKMLLQKIRKKMETIEFPFNQEALVNIKSFWDFDEIVTAKLYGFESAKDYYQKSSSFHYISKIQKPTLIIQAVNDPFFFPDIIPSAHTLPEQVLLEVHKEGGHVGFMTGHLPWRPQYWLEERIPSFLQNF